jgi:hypothetical protein
MTITSANEIAELVQRLESVRQRHIEAIGAIDETLKRVRDALHQVNKHVADTTGDLVDATAAAALPRPRNGRFSQTAIQSVLDFIRRTGTPSTSELSAHWRSEGRKGTVYVTILQLLKAGQIRRLPDSSVRGSRYALVESPSEKSGHSGRSRNADKG